MSNIAWAYVENIAIVLCATVLSYAWGTGWPFLLLLFLNTITVKEGK